MIEKEEEGMSIIRKSILFIILFLSCFFLNKNISCAKYYELKLNSTVSGRLYWDVDNENESDWYRYETVGKTKLKYTVRVTGHDQFFFNEDYLRCMIFDENDSEYELNKVYSDNNTIVFENIITTDGTISLFVDYLGITFEYMDYTLTVEDLTTYGNSISMAKSLKITIGESYKIKRTISPSNAINKNITWHSSNPKIASVDSNGKVTAKKKGNCDIVATLRNGISSKCSVKVINPTPYINYKKATVNTGQKFKLKICYSNKKVKWTSSNKNIATVSSNGQVKATGIGKCTITGKAGKKTYKCAIVVIRQVPNFGAVLTDYNTRDNYFTVRFANKSNKPVTIYSSNAKVEDIDYKSYDRYLRLANNQDVVIKPGQSVYLRFYVIGGITWYDHTDYTLIYKFKFDEQIYEGHVWYANSCYYNGKGWYHTYSNDEWYLRWY